MRYSNNTTSGFLWQSFDFPTDTLFPEMKLGYDRKTGRSRFLTSWRSKDDPSSGNFTYKLDTRRGLPEFFVMANDFEIYRSGPWNGIEFSGIPKAKDQGLSFMVCSYTENSDEVSYTFRIASQSFFYSRLTIEASGNLDLFTTSFLSSRWRALRNLPVDECDYYNLCGSYAYCEMNLTFTCKCFQGFDLMNPEQLNLTERSGFYCMRRTPLSCSGNRFLVMKNMKLPDTKMASFDRRIDLQKCQERCLSDCDCTSFAAADVRNGGTGCLIWRGDLNDTRIYSLAGQDLYVKIAAVDTG
ncbi:Receptor-like serine/threonine-protein kinase SD1-8 [Raphanus sativus]|nr:Receptor-like serine/threonine-protein kinase SD1-8 [Raphanus sativus]